jgi:hypothetical protein
MHTAEAHCTLYVVQNMACSVKIETVVAVGEVHAVVCNVVACSTP